MLVELAVKEFLNKVAGSDPVPGGGSIAALNGAIASALAAMVANLTIGKKGYEPHEELMRHISEVALRQKELFVADIDRDSEAYDGVFACFKMPKATDEEKAARSAAIQEATKHAALVPMQVARNAYELMTILMDVARLGGYGCLCSHDVRPFCRARCPDECAYQPRLFERQGVCGPASAGGGRTGTPGLCQGKGIVG